MSRFVFIAVLLPAALMAAEPQFNLVVSLAASPAGQIYAGSPVTLTATSNQPREIDRLGVPQELVHYTFSAQRTSPASSTVIIAQDVAAKTVTWTPQNAGVYALSVRAIAASSTAPPKTPVARFVTASVANYNVLFGTDLIVGNDLSTSSCNSANCTECPLVTYPIHVQNVGNVTVATQIVVTVKYNGQTIQTWTTTAPAAGAKTLVGTYTTFPWNCPSITVYGSPAPNYSITVDSANAVAETNEQNNVRAFYLRFPDKTSFHAK